MGIRIGRFCPEKLGFKPMGLGFGLWEWEINVKNQKWDRIWKKLSWEMGLILPLQVPLSRKSVSMWKGNNKLLQRRVSKHDYLWVTISPFACFTALSLLTEGFLANFGEVLPQKSSHDCILVTDLTCESDKYK